MEGNWKVARAVLARLALVLAAGLMIDPVLHAAVATGPNRAGREQVCKQVLATLGTRRVFRLPLSTMQRVEIRTCEEGSLQLVAWEKDRPAPSLVVETNRTSIVQLLVLGNVFVFETAGASSDVVQVILFEAGKPRLAFNDAFKATARIETSWKTVRMTVRNDDGSERTLTFPTGLN